MKVKISIRYRHYTMRGSTLKTKVCEFDIGQASKESLDSRGNSAMIDAIRQNANKEIIAVRVTKR